MTAIVGRAASLFRRVRRSEGIAELSDPVTLHWQPDRSKPLPPVPPGGPAVGMATALWRGARGICPGCGKTPIFNGYLRVRGACPRCFTPLDQVRADDAPPYFTILIAGHIIVPAMLLCEALFSPRVWVETAIWVPLTFIATLALLRPVKGCTVALMLKLNMLKPENEA